ncbi:MAG TPA: hypothetical protein VIH87_09135 [Methylocella sp.]
MKTKSHLAGILTGLALAGLQLIRATPVFAANNVVKEFDAGFGPNSVGVVDASEDTEIAGPQAIYAGDDGEIYLLDQVNARVVGFDAKEPGARTRSLALPEGMEPTDLIVAKGSIYVWDGKPIPLEASEGGLSRSVAPGGGALAPDNTAWSMFGQMGSEQVSDDASGTRSLTPAPGRLVGRQLIATHGKGPVTADVTRDKNETAARVDVRQSAATLLAKLQLKVRDKLGSVEFLDIDQQGRMFVLAENIPAVAMEGASTFVARFSPMGALEGIYELPLTPSVALSRRFVTVSPGGDVYFLRTRKGVVDVIGVGFRVMKNGKGIDVRGPAPNYADLAKDRKGAIAAVRPLTRARVLETARGFEGITWRLNARSYGPDPDARCSGFNRVRRPGYLIGRAGQDVRGIPYCWGCQGSLGQIANKIGRGALAGNVCTRDNPRYDVVGVDCSSFVSAAWGLTTHFTTAAIPSIAPRISNPWDLKPGDALNKPGSHVMLFLGFTPDRKAEVFEASPGGCNGRVCHNVYPLAALLARGYEPRRFRALLN